MQYVGIDPGIYGGLAIIDDTGKAEVYDTPTLTVGKKRTLFAQAMISLLCTFTEPMARVTIESVHAMPNNSSRSMFSFGYGAGAWEGIVATLGYPYQFVTPQAWKRSMMEGMGKDKDASRLVAVRLFPALADGLSRKKDHGRADALLIAEYGRRKWEGEM